MRNVYFVRHAECDYSVRDDSTRPLTDKGKRDCALVTGYLADKSISLVASSPYKRACDTVSGFAKAAGLPIVCVDDFRERRVTDGWVDDFAAYSRRQWTDFDYKLPGGESLREVQQRSIAALNRLLGAHPGENIAIGTHGTALSAILNFYNGNFGYDDFWKIIDLMPWVVQLSFEGTDCVGIETVDLFSLFAE